MFKKIPEWTVNHVWPLICPMWQPRDLNFCHVRYVMWGPHIIKNNSNSSLFITSKQPHPYPQHSHRPIPRGNCFLICGSHMTYPTWQKFKSRGDHIDWLIAKYDWQSTGVFFKHFGYFECKYEPIVNSGCPVLLDGYLKGRLGPLIPRGKNLTHVETTWAN